MTIPPGNSVLIHGVKRVVKEGETVRRVMLNGPPTIKGLLAMIKAITGKDVSPEKIEEMRVKFAALGASTPVQWNVTGEPPIPGGGGGSGLERRTVARAA